MSDQAIVSIVTTLIAVLGTLAGVQVSIHAGQKAEKRKVVRDKLEDIYTLLNQVNAWAAYQHEELWNLYVYLPNDCPPTSHKSRPSCPTGRLEVLIRLHLPSLRKISQELSKSVLKLKTVEGNFLERYEDEADINDNFLYENDRFKTVVREAYKEFEEAHAKLLSSLDELAKKILHAW